MHFVLRKIEADPKPLSYYSFKISSNTGSGKKHSALLNPPKGEIKKVRDREESRNTLETGNRQEQLHEL